ncbi:MAG: DUF5719 family protein [Leifsonia sp.]
MSTKRTVVVAGARTIGGLAGIAVAVGLVAAAAFVPWPSVEVGPVADRVVPVPTDAQRVCPGPLLTLAEDSGQATAASSIGSASIVSAAGPGEDDPDETPLGAPDDANAAENGGASVLTVPASPDATTPPLIAGSQTQVAADETHSGLAVAACTEAVPDAWLIGGSTDIGRTTLVLLSNPSSVLATVDLTVYGETGPITAPGATGILVQPGTQRIVSLAGLAPDVLSPVVHVTSQGGEVAAALQQSIVRGLDPGGVDIVGPTSAPSTNTTIPGVIVGAAISTVATDSEAGYSDEQPGLRLVAPGDTAAQATVSVVGENGAPGTSFSVDLEPGIVVEAPLSDLAAGVYSITVESDEPVVAAARTAVAGADGRDIAWFAASTPLAADATLVAAAGGAVPTLHAWNPGGRDLSITLTPGDGEPITLDLPAATALPLALRPGVGYEITGADGVIASVGYATDSRLASFTLTPIAGLAAPITVYTR